MTDKSKTGGRPRHPENEPEQLTFDSADRERRIDKAINEFFKAICADEPGLREDADGLYIENEESKDATN